MISEQIERINELTRLSRERALTPEETQERARLRAAYIQEFRQGVRQTLENTKVEYPDGTRVPLKDQTHKH